MSTLVAVGVLLFSVSAVLGMVLGQSMARWVVTSHFSGGAAVAGDLRLVAAEVAPQWAILSAAESDLGGDEVGLQGDEVVPTYDIHRIPDPSMLAPTDTLLLITGWHVQIVGENLQGDLIIPETGFELSGELAEHFLEPVFAFMPYEPNSVAEQDFGAIVAANYSDLEFVDRPVEHIVFEAEHALQPSLYSPSLAALPEQSYLLVFRFSPVVSIEQVESTEPELAISGAQDADFSDSLEGFAADDLENLSLKVAHIRPLLAQVRPVEADGDE